MTTKTVERVLVILVVLHTLVVGVALMLAPEWALRFGGWEQVSPLFFPCQAGVFHLVLAAGYLLEYYRQGSVTFLVAAKTIAFVFLIAAALIGGVPWIVPFSGVTDGLMGLNTYPNLLRKLDTNAPGERQASKAERYSNR